MSMSEQVKTLHPLEIKALRWALNVDQFTAATLGANALDNQGQARQAISWLGLKSFISEVSRSAESFFILTEFGSETLAKGLVEERILNLVKLEEGLTMGDLAGKLGIEQKDVGSAWGALSKSKKVTMGEGKVLQVVDANLPESLELLKILMDRALEAPGRELAEADLDANEAAVLKANSKKRGAANSLFKQEERETVVYTLSPEGTSAANELVAQGIEGTELGTLTPEMLKDGSWRDAKFRAYNLNVPPGKQYIGRRNPYCEYLDWVKDQLVGLGFEEFDGPLVETEFWNGDALFMPQFHAARDIHDVYYVKEPSHAKEIQQPFLDRVAAVHQNGGESGSRGWGYAFDRDFTRRLVLRSQGTVMSAKTLHKAKIPGKYFGIMRCFRYDQVDATHLSDFYQTEGIVLGEDVNMENLLGLLKMFAENVAGATEVKYVPGYFPFTEPSVEVHIKHPVLGWFELGGSGIFRPEVTKAMGIDVPVLAWGLGIDRMALMHLGLSDLRELFSTDLEKVRMRRRS